MPPEKSARRIEIGDIFRKCGAKYRAAHAGRLALRHLRTMRAIEICRTAALGGHLYKCDQCGHERPEYNSCRNRHCPKCQYAARKKWLAAREAELLPVPYFHVVFTIPHELEPIVIRNQRAMYEILFRAASATLLEIAADPKHLGARIGFLAILHTWGQALIEHTHLHFVVPGGGLSEDGARWIGCKKYKKGYFFLPVQVLSSLFRGKFLAYLQEARDAGAVRFTGKIKALGGADEFARLLRPLYMKEWVVYAKRPFAGPKQVLGYLASYTHRVAISNARITAFDGERVTFRYRDYADKNANKTMRIAAEEFIRRFLLHVLPERFTRIRYYGLLSNRGRREKIARCLEMIEAEMSAGRIERLQNDPPAESESVSQLPDDASCPSCAKGTLRLVAELAKCELRANVWRMGGHTTAAAERAPP